MPASGDAATIQPSRPREPGFGLALLLLSALGTVTGAAVVVLRGWGVGLAVYAAVIVALSLFLRWEMRRRAIRRTLAASQQHGPNVVVSETN